MHLFDRNFMVVIVNIIYAVYSRVSMCIVEFSLLVLVFDQKLQFDLKLTDARDTHPVRLRQQRICVFFQHPLKQIRAATQHAGDARQTHVVHASAVTYNFSLGGLLYFFSETHGFLC